MTLRAAHLICLLSIVAFGQAVCNQMSYEDKNQTDYAPIRVSRVMGVSNDKQAVAVPNVCIGLFGEGADHRLVMATNSDSDGHFRFTDVPPGDYRLVAKFDGFSPANARIRVERRGSKRPLVVRMRFAGLDTVSFVELN